MSFVIVPWIPKSGYFVQFHREPVDGPFKHTYGPHSDPEHPGDRAVEPRIGAVNHNRRVV